MAEEQSADRAEELQARAAWVRWRSRTLRAESARVAGHVADIEEAVAGTLARLASQCPDHAARLWAKSEAAAKHAAEERQAAARYSQPPERETGEAGGA